MINGIAYNLCVRSTSNTFSIYRHLDYQFNYINFGRRKKAEGKRCDVIICDKRREKCIKQQPNNTNRSMHTPRANSILYDAKRYLIIFKFIRSRVRHHYRFRGKHLQSIYLHSWWCTALFFFAFDLHVNHLRNIGVREKRKREKNYYIKC